MSPILTPASDTSYASTPGKMDRGRNAPLSDPHRLASRPRLNECALAPVTPLTEQPDVQALHPHDLIRYSFRGLRSAQPRIELSQLMEWVTSKGCAHGEATRAITYWRMLWAITVEGTWLHFHEEVARQLEAQTHPGDWAPIQHGPYRWPAATDARPIALVSLFDGSGLARITVDVLVEALRQHDVNASLHSSIFAEQDGALARAVTRYWSNRASLTRRPRHRQMAGNVWDLLRKNEDTSGQWPLRDFAAGLPPGTIILVVAGSPCQDLTTAGRLQGRRGICGDRSVLIHAVSVVCWMLTQLRGHCLTHAVVEKTATMNPTQRAAILRLFGLPDHHAVTLDAKHLGSPFPRARMFLSTLPPPDDITNGRSYSAATKAVWESPTQVWDRGWAPRRDGTSPTMMRSRGPSKPRASTYQFPPRHLVYRVGGLPQWHEGSQAALLQKILAHMPTGVRSSYLALLADDRGNEGAAQKAAEWIDRHGAAVGFRPPNTAERLRATGSAAYLQSLQLTEVQLFQFDWQRLRPPLPGTQASPTFVRSHPTYPAEATYLSFPSGCLTALQ